MQPDNEQADYTRFLRGVTLPEFIETDNFCVTTEVRNDTTCLMQIFPLYYHLTRSQRRVAVAKLKKMFGCGAELITRVKHTIAQKADSDSAKRKKEHQKQQCFEWVD